MPLFVTTREKKYDDNMEAMLECVRISHSNAWSEDPMMQLKVTALLNPELCVRQRFTVTIDTDFRKWFYGAFLEPLLTYCSCCNLDVVQKNVIQIPPHFITFLSICVTRKTICGFPGFWGHTRTLCGGRVAEHSSNLWEKKIRVHILVFGVSIAVSCDPISPSIMLILCLSSHWWVCAAWFKVKLTTLIAQQPCDLNLLVKAMDGEVRP